MRTPSEIERYLAEVFPLQPFGDIELLGIQRALEESGKIGMALGAAEGRFLQFLIQAFGLHKIVEIGTLYGHSALVMAKVLPAEGHLWTLEKSPEHAAEARQRIAASKVGARVSVLEGDALKLLDGLTTEGPFDMVFIDADKGGYGRYLDWAEKNVRPGGIIVGDNTFLFGEVIASPSAQDSERLKTMREFNRRLADPHRFNSVLIPTSEGLTVAQKR